MVSWLSLSKRSFNISKTEHQPKKKILYKCSSKGVGRKICRGRATEKNTENSTIKPLHGGEEGQRETIPKNSNTISAPCMKIQGGKAPCTPAADAHVLFPTASVHSPVHLVLATMHLESRLVGLCMKWSTENSTVIFVVDGSCVHV